MKKFTMTATEDNNRLNIEIEVEGFNTLEIIGVLELKLRDIYSQIDAPAKFTRKRIMEDGTVVMIEEAQDD